MLIFFCKNIKIKVGKRHIIKDGGEKYEAFSERKRVAVRGSAVIPMPLRQNRSRS